MIRQVNSLVLVTPRANGGYCGREVGCGEDVIYLVLHYSVIVEGHGNFGGELCEGEGRLLDDSDRRAIGGGVKVAEEDCGKRILLIHRRKSIEKKRCAEDSRLIGDVVEVGIADSDESACCALSVHADAGYSRAGGLLGKARAGDARRGTEPEGINAVTDQAILQGGDGYSLSVKMLAAEEDIEIVAKLILTAINDKIKEIAKRKGVEVE